MSEQKLVSRFEYAFIEALQPEKLHEYRCLSEFEEREQRAQRLKQKVESLVSRIKTKTSD